MLMTNQVIGGDWWGDEVDENDLDDDNHAYDYGYQYDNFFMNDDHHENNTNNTWKHKSKKSASGVLNAGVSVVKKVADQGLDKLKDAWEKVKSAAEETADASSRPRHW